MRILSRLGFFTVFAKQRNSAFVRQGPYQWFRVIILGNNDGINIKSNINNDSSRKSVRFDCSQRLWLLCPKFFANLQLNILQIKVRTSFQGGTNKSSLRSVIKKFRKKFLLSRNKKNGTKDAAAENC